MSVFERPNLAISRVDNACHSCRVKRIRCDLATPSCSACKKFNLACTAGRTKEAGIKGHEIRYHIWLENRVIELQEQVEARFSDKHVRTVGDKSPVDPSIHNVVAEVGALALSASSQQTLLHRWSGLLFTQVVLATAGCKYTSVCSTELAELPKRGLVDQLIAHYSDTVWPLLPFLSLEDLTRQVQSVYSHYPTSPHYDTFTVLIVLAISTKSLAHSQTSLATCNSGRFLQLSLIHLREFSMQTLAGLQANLLLVQYALLNSSALDPWYLLGNAMRTCIELGLHKKVSDQTDLVKQELQRRLFWTAYTLDRYYSMSLGMTLDVSEASIDANFPSLYENWTQSVGQAFILRLTIRRLQAKCYLLHSSNQQLGCDVFQLRQELLRWMKEVTNGSLDGLSQEVMRLEYYHAIYLLLRPTHHSSQRVLADVIDLYEACSSYVTAYRVVDRQYHTLSPTLVAQTIYNVGLTMIFCVWNCQSLQSRYFETVRTCTEFIICLSTLQCKRSNRLGLLEKFEAVSSAFISKVSGDVNVDCPVEVRELPSLLQQSITSRDREAITDYDLMMQDLASQIYSA